MDRIAVLGGGNSGQCLAADCKLAGREVRLYEQPEYAKGLTDLMKHKTVKVIGPQLNAKGFKREGEAVLDTVTVEMGEAVKGAEAILISVQAIGYEGLFSRLIPHLEHGQVICLYPDNFGSLILRRLMREMNCDRKVLSGGWSSLPYGVRVIKRQGYNEIFLLYRAVTLRGDTLPSRDRKPFFDAMAQLPPMDTVDPVNADTVLDVGLSNINPVLHVPAVLLNLGAIDNWGVSVGDKNSYYDIYRHGFSEHVARVQYAFHEEEQAIARALGVGIQTYEEKDFRSRMSVLGEEFMGKGYGTPLDQATPESQAMKFEPGDKFTVQSRYLTEDVPVGCRIFYELAKKAGVKTPVIESMIRLASVVHGKDYFTQGFNLRTLGLAVMERQQMLDYLRG